ncbi:hypothetical protein L6C91_13875, partial [Staphylococcus aureus]|nr:hypothetical protein [Staphylococcus aureus]
VNNNKVTLNNEEKARLEQNGSDRFWVDYSNLDRLGRAGQVTALVTSQSVHENIKMAYIIHLNKRGKATNLIIKLHN